MHPLNDYHQRTFPLTPQISSRIRPNRVRTAQDNCRALLHRGSIRKRKWHQEDITLPIGRHTRRPHHYSRRVQKPARRLSWPHPRSQNSHPADQGWLSAIAHWWPAAPVYRALSRSRQNERELSSAMSPYTQSNGRLQDWQATTDRFPSRKQPAKGAPVFGAFDEMDPSLPLRISEDSLTAELARVM